MKASDYPLFYNNQCSLQETSKDDSSGKSQYMTMCTKTVVNFDHVKTSLMNSFGESEECASSVDALVFQDDYVYFIEFKNGNPENYKKTVINKAKDSVLVFNCITSKQLDFNRTNCVFILVYNKNKLENPKDRLSLAKAEKGNIMCDLFGTHKLEKLWFSKAISLDEDQFRNQIVERNGWK